MARWPGQIPPGSISNQLQAHEDLYLTLATAAGQTDLKGKLLVGTQLGQTTYKVHLDGYDNTALWTGKSKKSARREYFYYDETDLMALRVDDWKLSFGVKKEGIWWNPKAYPSVPYIFNLRMDPLEKMDPESHEWGYAGRKFVAQKLWESTAAGPHLAAHLQSLNDFPPSQGSDTLSMKKAVDEAMKKISKHVGD
jgi:arylsulfatase